MLEPLGLCVDKMGYVYVGHLFSLVGHLRMWPLRMLITVFNSSL
jgi:hypothetical protein